MEKIKGKRILVVDDDYHFRMILEKSLIRLEQIVTCAENAKQAQQMISLEEFDLVVSDIRMPEMTGIELLEWIRKNKTVPVILMTGFSEILETHQAIELGAQGFLAKPFKTEELIEVIRACFPGMNEGGKDENISAQFCKIGIDDFISGKQMQFDIFVRINDSKYIKVAHGGENIDPERVRVYKEKNVRYLYVKKDDFKTYLNINLTLSKKVAESDQISHEKKVNFIKHASEIALQNLYVNEITREDYMNTTALVENAISIMSDDPDASELILTLSKHTDFLYAHSVGVSFYAALLGKKMGWNAASTIFKLSVGGLMHDIGKKQISRNILEKPKKDMNAEEIAILESHATRGAEIIGALQSVPSDILQIVHEHHENCLGFGYPSRLKKLKIHPLARVIAVANDFTSLVVKNPNSVGIKPHEAIQKMMTVNPEYYDREVLDALIKIFPQEIPATGA